LDACQKTALRFAAVLVLEIELVKPAEMETQSVSARWSVAVKAMESASLVVALPIQSLPALARLGEMETRSVSGLLSVAVKAAESSSLAMVHLIQSVLVLASELELGPVSASQTARDLVMGLPPRPAMLAKAMDAQPMFRALVLPWLLARLLESEWKKE
jgi:hypothetical protein